MNKTLIKTLKMWGEYSNEVEGEFRRVMNALEGDSSKQIQMTLYYFSYGKFMDWWYEKEKDNLEVGE